MRKLLLLALLIATPAMAATVAGVTMPETRSIQGADLVLNGAGLREKYFFDIYVAGLYLPVKTTSSAVVLDGDTVKRLEFEFLLDLTAEQLGDSMRERLERTEGAQQHAGTIVGWMTAVEKGDRMVMHYVPGVGTTIQVGSTVNGPIAGEAVMKALFGIYVGSDPASEGLKRDLLGL